MDQSDNCHRKNQGAEMSGQVQSKEGHRVQTKVHWDLQGRCVRGICKDDEDWVLSTSFNQMNREDNKFDKAFVI